MFYISKEVNRINSAEAFIGNISVIDNFVIIPFSNLFINGDGEDKLFNKNINSYLNFCYIVFEDVESISFNYEESRLMSSKNRECYGGINYLTNKDVEFWINYKQAKIFIKEDYIFKKSPDFFSEDILKNILSENIIDNGTISSLVMPQNW